MNRNLLVAMGQVLVIILALMYSKTSIKRGGCWMAIDLIMFLWQENPSTTARNCVLFLGRLGIHPPDHTPMTIRWLTNRHRRDDGNYDKWWMHSCRVIVWHYYGSKGQVI